MFYISPLHVYLDPVSVDVEFEQRNQILIHSIISEEKMASANVDKMLKTLSESGVLTAELQLVFSKIEEAAEVDLTKDEKREFVRELAEMTSKEILIIWA